MESARHRSGFAVVAMIVLTVVALAAAGCGIIRPTRGRHFEDTERSGFLGNYSQLAPREGFDAQEVYVNPKAAWPRYNAIYIESVTLWVSDESKKPDPKDQQMLTDMLYKSMHDKLGEKFKLVKEPGPGVIQLRMALTEAKGARIALNTVTTVIPQARVVSTIAGLGTDTAALVGAASAEARGDRRDHQRAARRRRRLARGHQGHHADALEMGRRRGDLRSLGRAHAGFPACAGRPAEGSAEEGLSAGAQPFSAPGGKFSRICFTASPIRFSRSSGLLYWRMRA